MQLTLSRKPKDDAGQQVEGQEGQEAQPAAKSHDLSKLTPDDINGKVRNEGLVGLDISGTGLAAARVADGRIRSAAVTTLDPEIFNDGDIADPRALGAAIAEFFAASGLPNKVRMGVASPRVVIRTIETPAIADRKEFSAAVRFQASDHIPMPLDEAVIDYQVLEVLHPTEAGEAPKFRVMLVAASRSLIDTLMETSRFAGVKLQGVDLAAFSLIRTLYPGQMYANETIAYLHFGDMLNVTLAKGPVCTFTRATPIGYEALVTRLAERVNLTRAHSQMWIDHVGAAAPLEALQGDRDIVIAARQEITAALEQLGTDITAAIDFHSVQDPTARVSRVILAGPGASIPGAADSIAQRIGLPVEVPTPLGAIDPTAIEGTGIDQRRLTIAAGLAIEEVAAQ